MFREWRMKRLRKKVQSSDPQIRLQTAAKLFCMGDDTVHGILNSALEDEKLCPPAALAFEKAGRLVEALPKVERMLLSTKSTWTAVALALNLMYAKEPEALPVLATFITKRKSNEFPLWKAPGSDFQPIAVAEDGESIFEQVIGILGQKGNREVVSALEVALKDPSSRVQKAAQAALATLKGRV